MSSKTALPRVLLKLLPLSRAFSSIFLGWLERLISKKEKYGAPISSIGQYSITLSYLSQAVVAESLRGNCTR